MSLIDTIIVIVVVIIAVVFIFIVIVIGRVETVAGVPNALAPLAVAAALGHVGGRATGSAAAAPLAGAALIAGLGWGRYGGVGGGRYRCGWPTNEGDGLDVLGIDKEGGNPAAAASAVGIGNAPPAAGSAGDGEILAALDKTDGAVFDARPAANVERVGGYDAARC